MAIHIVGDREVFDTMLFGQTDPRLQQYIHQTQQYFTNMLTDVGLQFVNHAQNVFARMNQEEAVAIAKAAMRATNIYFQHDVIDWVSSVTDIQEAPNAMLPWIMAHPVLTEYHNNGTIDAYGSRYSNPYPTLVGWDNPYYYQVYGGWVNEVVETNINDKGEEVTETYDVWEQVLIDEDDFETPKLSDIEAAMIIHAHSLVDEAIANKIDPTSIYDSSL